METERKARKGRQLGTMERERVRCEVESLDDDDDSKPIGGKWWFLWWFCGLTWCLLRSYLSASFFFNFFLEVLHFSPLFSRVPHF